MKVLLSEMEDQINCNVLVSIIVPFYNVECYIEKTLKSIENQFLKDFEVILINDGSTDNSVKIVESFFKKCTIKHKLINQINSGVSNARNKGLLHVSGKYVVFVDADDIIAPSYLSGMYNNIAKYKVHTTICNFHSFYDKNEYDLNKPQHNKKVELLDSSVVMRRYLIERFHISVGSFMVETKLLKKYKLSFASGFKWDEDNHFIWRMITHSSKIVLDDSSLYYYRMRSGSAMTEFDEDRLKGIDLYKELENYLEDYQSEFAKIFKKYGVARWVWSLLWQASCALSYKQFSETCLRINAIMWMERIKDFPDSRVSISARIFSFSKYMFYYIARTFAKINGASRQ